jgi:pimeloyl-ACP methyl ester carboxylesterase
MHLPRIQLSTLILSGLRIYALLVLLVFLFQDKLIYFPKDHPFQDCKGALLDGFSSVDTKTVGEMHVRMLRRRSKGSRAWLVLFHGNGGTACSSLMLAERISALPIAIALVEYPGYEGDGEKPTQDALLANGLAAFDLVKADDPEIPIVLYGESLGTAVATYVASKRKPAGLILQSPFTSAAEVGQHRYPFLPVQWLTRNPFPASEWAINVDAPVLALHGTADWSVPLRFGEAEAKNFKNLTRLVKIDGAGHNDVTEKDPGRFWGEVSGFILEHLKPLY